MGKYPVCVVRCLISFEMFPQLEVHLWGSQLSGQELKEAHTCLSKVSQQRLHQSRKNRGWSNSLQSSGTQFCWNALSPTINVARSTVAFMISRISLTTTTLANSLQTGPFRAEDNDQRSDQDKVPPAETRDFFQQDGCHCNTLPIWPARISFFFLLCVSLRLKETKPVVAAWRCCSWFLALASWGKIEWRTVVISSK